MKRWKPQSTSIQERRIHNEETKYVKVLKQSFSWHQLIIWGRKWDLILILEDDVENIISEHKYSGFHA
jgi:hypothetical protein